ncbi:uncharacterized protein [Arachis hypogaea]|uniref:uncharacterized protein n=1 Tax=Arachis hypogaea TaxID=3818 RepID=UPI003B2263D9
MDASVPFNAVNLAYYQPMIDAIANMGARYKGPNYGRVRRYLLSKLVEDVKKMIEDYHEIWKQTGCTIMADGWTDRYRHNAANYVATRRLLESEFPRLYWSSCEAHCVNLMFQDIKKLEEVSETVSQVSMITKEWTSSAYSKEAKAKKFVNQVLDSKFYNQCTDIIKLIEPLVRVLCIVDSKDRAAIGFLYQAIYKAREEMVKRFQKIKRVVDPYLKILDTHWDSHLRKNLHAVGYWLNPVFRFNAREFEKHKQTTSGLLDVIERYTYSDADLNSKLTKWIMEDSPLFLTSKEVDALQNDLANMSLQSALDDLDQLNLKDDRDDDEANNNFVENTNQNETNQDVAPDLSDEERYPDFEITPWI